MVTGISSYKPAISIVVSLLSGSVDLSLSQLFEELTQPQNELRGQVLREIRIPRTMAAFTTGGLLALAGVIMQVLLRNPLADPYILGISGGAAVGALSAILIGVSGWWLSNAAFAGALISVLLGRHPHVQTLLRDDPADIEIAKKVLNDLDLEEFSERQVDTLSGGERQRLALAMLMAQTPRLFLLDEPSNHLDVAFQVKLLSVLEKRMAEQSASLLMATHDINLAARFCDKIILLTRDGGILTGSRQEVLTDENLSEAYDCPIRSIVSDDFVLFYPW